MDLTFEDYLSVGGMGLTLWGGLETNKNIAMAAGARSRAHLENAKTYRQNAIYEGINAQKRGASIRKSYKRVQERIAASTRASGFRQAGELRREAELNERRAVEQMRFGSAMMSRNFSIAARRSIDKARGEISSIKYQQRANLINTGANVTGQFLDWSRSGG